MPLELLAGRLPLAPTPAGAVILTARGGVRAGRRRLQAVGAGLETAQLDAYLARCEASERPLPAPCGTAIAGYDRWTGKFWASRGHGLAPRLVTTRQSAGLAVASSARQLFEAGLLNPRLSRSALLDSLILGAPVPPETLFEEVAAVRDGELVTADGSAPGLRPTTALRGLQVDLLREALTSAVTTAGPRVGVLLSGGLDSALLAALASGDQEVRTLTASFESAAGPQVDYVTEIREELGLQGWQVALTPSLAELWQRQVLELELPLCDLGPAAVNTAAELRLAADTAVVLSGLGADELCGGPPPLLKPSSGPAAPGLRRPWLTAADAAQQYGLVPTDWPAWSALFSLRCELLAPEFLAELGGAGDAPPRAPLPPDEIADLPQPLGRARLNLALRTGPWRAPALALAGPGLRAPFLDPDLQPLLGARLDWRSRWSKADKPQLRTLAERVLPRSLALRPKRPRLRPNVAWLLCDPLPPALAEALHPARLRAAGWFDPVTVYHWLELVRHDPHGPLNRLRVRLLLTAAGVMLLAARHGLVPERNAVDGPG